MDYFLRLSKDLGEPPPVGSSNLRGFHYYVVAWVVTK
jgi:hypothetical protein